MTENPKTTDRSLKFFVIAGENSGDQLASMLIREIQQQAPSATFEGLGSTQMKACGVNLLIDMVEEGLAIIGITQVIKKLRPISQAFDIVYKRFEENRPDAIILVDYPGFNLRVAKKAKELGIPVIYYVLPQVWAWKKKRIITIRECVDLMIVLFPFEEKFCVDKGVNAWFGGYPWLDHIVITRTREETCERQGLDKDKPIIGILPGSRKPEIVRILPAMLEACELLYEKDQNLQFVLARATSVPEELVQKYIKRTKLKVKILDRERYNVRSCFDFTLVKSGTATLETAIFESPMIIIYKTSSLTWLIGKFLIDLHYIGLVNHIAEKMIVPEILQDQATGLRISEEFRDIYYNPTRMESTKLELQKVKKMLGGKGASKNNAHKILEFLEELNNQTSTGNETIPTE